MLISPPRERVHNNGDKGVSGARGAVMPSGLHHAAWVCRDFYERALGMRLRSIFPMHGVSGAKHCFMEAGNGAELSFVEFKDEDLAKPTTGSPGSQHHFAFKCDSVEQMDALHAQIKAAGAKISPPIDHGMCRSAYFADPINGFLLEITTTSRPYLPAEFDTTLLERCPLPEEDLFHPKHAEYLAARAKL
jgi:catechol 2,3-dioxygenase-like lactoylglutathione lyase family enzyme